MIDGQDVAEPFPHALHTHRYTGRGGRVSAMDFG